MRASGPTFKLKDHRNVAARLKVARVEAKMSMDEIGKLVSLAQPQISRIESGIQAFFSASVRDRVLKLAEALGVKGLEFEEAHWDTGKSKPRPAQKPMPSLAPQRERKPEGYTLTPFQQILAIIEIQRMGALETDDAFAAIRGICTEQR